MRLIETTHLKTWAGSKPAESRFPYIVKGLICASIHPEKLRMPSGDAVWLPGFDGVVVNGEENRFVPTGLSVWELGTNDDFRDKARKDYEKRSKDKAEDGESKATQKIDRIQITFVFVTPRVWKDKDDWIAERKAEGIWKDIVVIDGVDLQDWLESMPSIHLQFAAELGIVPEAGLQTPDQAWEEWSYRTDPPLSEELVTAGRDEQEKELIRRLIAPPSTFTVRGDSPSEAWGFALAAMRRINSEDERLSLCSRTIIADNDQVAGRLRYLNNLIIILKQAHNQVSGFLSSHGCHVIIPEGNDARSERNVIVLSRPTHRLFAEALERMRLPQVEAERVARACGLSITILQRQRPHANFVRPQWADAPSVVNLLPALLAGRWNNRSDADREILCQLAENSEYDRIESHLHEFLLVDEPPLQKVGEMWALTAPVDAFQLIARRLTTANLERFKRAFRKVFSRIDPKVEIPPDEWLYHDIKGDRSHSGWLRSGMAETLLLIAERGRDARLLCIHSPHTFADEVVRNLPGLNDDWRVLASLRDQYPRLMEASPGPFLHSLEHLLEAKPDDLRRLFAEGENILGGGAMHTGLLWALEVLAWGTDYLARVSHILAKLARLDPGGRMANRPINSLREIFLWWHPGTNASLEQRLAAIDLILAHEPTVGWELLANLLPKATPSISHPTAKPRWRDFGGIPDDTRSRRGQVQYLSAIIDRTLDRVGTNPDRWSAILESLRTLSPAQQEKAMDMLNEIVQGPLPTQLRAALWEMLRDFTYQHRTFRDADWALSEGLVDQLELILDRLAPDDSVERNKWLFDEWLPELPSGETDYKQREKMVNELREQAIKEILQTQGLEGVVRLGTISKVPGFIASIIVSLKGDIETIHRLIEIAISAGKPGIFLAGQISGQAQKVHGKSWCELVMKQAKAGAWPPNVIASLMIWWPDERPTWESALGLGKDVAAEYWRWKHVFTIDGTPEDQNYQIDRLIEAGRAAEAFDRVAMKEEGVPTESLLRLFDATMNELVQAKTADDVRRLGLNSYDMRHFLDNLRNREDLPREELARREYQALPLLGRLNAGGLAIHDFMAEDPKFFVEILCDVFLPAHRAKDNDDIEPTPEVKARAQYGYSLLEAMDSIPGRREGGQLDEEALLEWINAVREKAVAVDRAAIADQYIGKILAHASPDGEDGGWPHRIVRSVIEKLCADEIEHGLVTERYNMRGTYTKALYEGGTQERALASQYHGWAETSHVKWPRMARVLEAIAQGYQEDAQREDIRAEQDKLR